MIHEKGGKHVLILKRNRQTGLKKIMPKGSISAKQLVYVMLTRLAPVCIVCYISPIANDIKNENSNALLFSINYFS